MHINKNFYDPINISFSFLPISLVLGSLIVNINIAIFLIFSLKFFIEKKINLKFTSTNLILLLFFLTLSLSSLINIKIIGFENFIKSILVLKFFFIYFFLEKLIVNKKINFDFFFKIIFFLTLIISLDLIIQFFTGKNILGFTPHEGRITGIFQAEAVAGAFLQKLFIFSLIGFYLMSKNKNRINFIEILFYLIIVFGVFVSSNRISFILIVILLLLITILFKVFRKNLLILIFILLPIIFFTYKFNESVQIKTIDFQNQIKSSFVDFFFHEENASKNTSVNHGKLYYSAIETFKLKPVIGGGLKSFKFNCFILEEQNKLCSTHPHNYHLEILNDTGIVGFVILLLFALFILKNKIISLKNKIFNMDDKIIFSLILLNFCLEIFPLKSSGSIFSTWTGTLVWLSVALINYDKKINNS